MQRLFEVPQEAALACGVGLTFVTFLCVIPAGLLYARLEHVSLTEVAEESERLRDETTKAVKS
jgi:glycosyltransferase 2 family protein